MLSVLMGLIAIAYTGNVTATAPPPDNTCVQKHMVVVGNGGDELLFNIALAWGGPGRKFLNLPPTFSVYAANARLTNTRCVDVPRRADFSIDEAAVLERVGKGDIVMLLLRRRSGRLQELVRGSRRA